MASFVRLDENNIVIQGVAVSNDVVDNLPFPESEPLGVAFLTDWSGGYTNWKQTSYNGNFRVNYAGLNYYYDAQLDAFIPPQPYPSWALNPNTLKWEAPISCPDDGFTYEWDEVSQSWVLIGS